jgi:sarcosine reductase
VVSAGNANEIIQLPPMKTVIGDLSVADIIAGGFDGSKATDGSLTVELQVITGATNELGYYGATNEIQLIQSRYRLSAKVRV